MNPFIVSRLSQVHEKAVLKIRTTVLVLRLLYRLRFLSEQATFDAATFSYAFPLLSHILVTGGVLGGDEENDPVEQVALSVEILRFHSGECKHIELGLSDTFLMLLFVVASHAYPRLQAINNLIHVIRQQPSLRKDASSALIGLGEGISGNATPAEIDAFIGGILAQESYARSSCLQAVQVRS